MAELLNALSDDELAMLGCAAALFVCGLLMCLSYYVGRAVRRSQPAERPRAAPAVVRFTGPA
ncbi:MAG: hypothetical protein ACREJB_13300, partial [Planctomycetaceae bacterium]